MEDIFITLPIDCDISKNLNKELEKYPEITKTNGYRRVFFHKKTDKEVIYAVRYGQVRDQSIKWEANHRGPMPEKQRQKISAARKGSVPWNKGAKHE